jgi:hypothetical protein
LKNDCLGHTQSRSVRLCLPVVTFRTLRYTPMQVGFAISAGRVAAPAHGVITTLDFRED